MTRSISLSQGYEALVDDEDYPALAANKWQILKASGKLYARRISGGRSILMHNQITGYARTDHIDGNGLNNTRFNLREATQRQNMHNRRPSGGSSRFIGVRLQRRTGRWEAYIKTNEKCRHLGTFNSEEEAARARDNAALERDAEFAYLNFPPGAQT